MTPVQETFTEALEFTSAFTLASHRRLPAERTVWLMLGMALMRDLPITEVARQLEVALPGADGSKTVASSALTQARRRLGADPMEWLFLRTSEEWAGASADRDRWRDLALYAVDGTTLRVADSPANRAHFGDRIRCGTGSATSCSHRAVWNAASPEL